MTQTVINLLKSLGINLDGFTSLERADLDLDDILKLLLLSPGFGSAGGGTIRTPVLSTVSSSGSVAAGKRYIEFVFSPDFAGTIGGVAWAGATDTEYSLPLLQGAITYPALAYTISAGSARLTTIV